MYSAGLLTSTTRAQAGARAHEFTHWILVACAFLLVADCDAKKGGRGNIKPPVVMTWPDLAFSCAKFFLAFSPIIALVIFFGSAHKNDKRLNAKKKFDFVESNGNDDRNAALSQFSGFGGGMGGGSGLSTM